MAAKEQSTLRDVESRQRAELLCELQNVRTQMERNETFFNMTADPDLTEYAIHERSALLARYRYLLQAIRQIDRQRTGAPLSLREKEAAAV